MHLFTIMNWISNAGYAMFPLTDSGKEIFYLWRCGDSASFLFLFFSQPLSFWAVFLSHQYAEEASLWKG